MGSVGFDMQIDQMWGMSILDQTDSTGPILSIMVWRICTFRSSVSHLLFDTCFMISNYLYIYIYIK